MLFQVKIVVLGVLHLLSAVAIPTSINNGQSSDSFRSIEQCNVVNRANLNPEVSNSNKEPSSRRNVFETESTHSRKEPSSRGKRLSEIRDGVKHTIFEHEATSSKMDFVTNSGVCETTPGVNQYSGYFSVGDQRNMWFWFFEARHKPETAPLTMWMNGGPGCSSMIGLFQENGPCQFYNGSSTPSPNPYSWNEYANMLYIDQPVGVGFSYETGASPPTVICDENQSCHLTGVVNGTIEVNSTIAAAPFVWKFMQAFYAQFRQYENRDFGIFTESYGGHFGPEFASYFKDQNALVTSGSIKGECINLVALGIINGCYDRLLLEKSQIDYLYSNPYYPLINESTHASLLHVLKTNATPSLEKCAAGGTDQQCTDANVNCILNVDIPMGNAADPNGTLVWYDIRQRGPDELPLSTEATYLLDPEIMRRIGAKTNYSQCSDPVHDQFSSTGDQARSQIPNLSKVVASGVQTLILAGDADVVCNWLTGLAVADSLAWSGNHAFAKKAVKDYKVNGKSRGSYKSVDNLSFLKVFNAGHKVPYFQPELSLQAFKQTMHKKSLWST